MATGRYRATTPTILGLLGDTGMAAAVIAAWMIFTRLVVGTPFTLHRIVGSAVMAVVLGTLISLLRKAHAKMETSENLWRTALGNISDGIGIIASDRSVIWANPVAAQLAGVPEESLTGMRCDDAWDCGTKGCNGCAVALASQDPVRTAASRAEGQTGLPSMLPPASYPRNDGKSSLVVFSDAEGGAAENQELRRQVAALKVQLRESAHRTKNNLQMVASLVSLAYPGEDQGALDELEQRIRLMGLVHEQLTPEQDEGRASLQGFLSVLSRAILDALTPPALQLSLVCSAPEWEVPARRAVSLGLIVNELMTNSIKHGFSGRSSGGIEIRGVMEDGFLALRYTDDGNGFPNPQPTSSPGSGIQLVGLIVSQLGGTMT
ncbi:MAG: hypothetical protein E4H09_03240, partial [Spirochaetales bacterium]